MCVAISSFMLSMQSSYTSMYYSHLCNSTRAHPYWNSWIPLKQYKRRCVGRTIVTVVFLCYLDSHNLHWTTNNKPTEHRLNWQWQTQKLWPKMVRLLFSMAIRCCALCGGAQSVEQTANMIWMGENPVRFSAHLITTIHSFKPDNISDLCAYSFSTMFSFDNFARKWTILNFRKERIWYRGWNNSILLFLWRD